MINATFWYKLTNNYTTGQINDNDVKERLKEFGCGI